MKIATKITRPRVLDDDDDDDDDDERCEEIERNARDVVDVIAGGGRRGFVANTYAEDARFSDDELDDARATNDHDARATNDHDAQDGDGDDFSDSFEDFDDDSDSHGDAHVEDARAHLERAFHDAQDEPVDDDDVGAVEAPTVLSAKSKNKLTKQSNLHAWMNRASNFMRDIVVALGDASGVVRFTEDMDLISLGEKIFRARVAMCGSSNAVCNTNWALLVKYDAEHGSLRMPAPGMNPKGIWCCILCLLKGNTMPLFRLDGDIGPFRRHAKAKHARELAVLNGNEDSPWKQRQSDVSVPKPMTLKTRAGKVLEHMLSDVPVERDKAKVSRVLWLATAWMTLEGGTYAMLTGAVTIINLIYYVVSGCNSRLPQFSHKMVVGVRKAFEKRAIERLRKQIKQAEYVTLSFDLWMNSRGQDVFALMANFSNKFGSNVSRVLGVVKNGTLRAEEMKSAIVDAAKLHPELQGKVVALVSDQGANVQKVTSALLKDCKFIYHPNSLQLQLLCAAHRFATLLRHAMEHLKTCTLYPEEKTVAAHGKAPYAKTENKPKGREGNDAGHFGSGIWTFGDLVARVIRGTNFFAKSSTAKREYDSVAGMLNAEGDDFLLEFDEARVRPPRTIPRTRFNFIVQMIDECLASRRKMQAAMAMRSTAVNKSRPYTWQDQDTISTGGYAVLEAMHGELELLGKHCSLSQSASHYTFVDVCLVVLLQTAASKKSHLESGEELNALENAPSNDASINEQLVQRACAKARHVLSGKIHSLLENQFEGLAAYAAASVQHESSSQIRPNPPEDVMTRCALMSLYLHPAMWASPELYGVVSTEDNAFQFEDMQPTKRVSARLERFMGHVFHELVWNEVVTVTQTRARAGASAAPEVDDAVEIARSVALEIELGVDVLSLWGSQGAARTAMEDEHAVRSKVKTEAFAYRTLLHSTKAYDLVYAPSSMKVNEKASMTIIAFWSQPEVRDKCPLLAAYARLLFSIPQTQCDCERLFSMFGRLTAGPRANTSLDSLQTSARVCFNLSPHEVYSMALDGGEVEVVDTDDDDDGYERDPSYDMRRAAAMDRRAEQSEIRRRHGAERMHSDVKETYATARVDAMTSAPEAAKSAKRRATLGGEAAAKCCDGIRRRRNNGTTPNAPARTQQRTPTE